MAQSPRAAKVRIGSIFIVSLTVKVKTKGVSTLVGHLMP